AHRRRCACYIKPERTTTRLQPAQAVRQRKGALLKSLVQKRLRKQTRHGGWSERDALETFDTFLSFGGRDEPGLWTDPVHLHVRAQGYGHMRRHTQFSRNNNSVQANSLKDLLQTKIDDLEKQVLSRVNGLEEGKPGLRNESEQRGRVESTLTSLHQRITDLEKGQKENRPLDKFQLTFPLRTNYMYAKVKKSLPEMYAFTVCMWLKSNASPGVGTPFSYAVPGQANELVLIEWGNNPMEMLINDKVAKLPFLINDGKWHHICITWTTRDGVWEAYQDGVMRGNGDSLAPYHPIKPQGVLILGQEQDTLGGGFDATQAFVGDMANFNIWDRKLSVGEIYNLATCSSKAQVGNVFSWLETSIEIYGGASKWTFEACRQLN
uniref:Neuronal pentraxin-1-like n=1 Tax=Sinocyclocheilus rhinocerous TaxID=307959 RepID=A0A673G6P3_9TELE